MPSRDPAFPRRLVSGLMGRWARSTLSRPMIRPFIRRYGVDVSEAEQPVDAYPNLSAFFARALVAGSRPLDPDPAALLCPCDGLLVRHGPIVEGTLVQAKGIDYRLSDLLATEDAASAFADGIYATIYLSPRDYHRVHAPITGRIVHTVHVGGTQYPVNARSAARVDRLYTRNERLISTFAHPAGGRVAVVQVGAFNVGSMERSYAGAPPVRRSADGVEAHTLEPPVAVGRGDEIGRFLLGSTVIVLASAGLTDPQSLPSFGSRVRVGQHLATLRGTKS